MGIWHKLFPSRVEALLREQLERERKTCQEVIVRLENDFSSRTSEMRDSYAERVKILADRYQDEVKYLRERVKTVEQEQERLTLFNHPNLNRISTREEVAAFDESEKNREPEPPVLTPWQKVVAQVRDDDMKKRREFEQRKQNEANEKDRQQPQTAA